MGMKGQTPEIRFAGFSEPWERRRFGDIVDRLSEFSSEAEFPRVEYEDIISGEGRLNKDIQKKESDKVGVLFEANDILFGKLRPYLRNWLLPDFKGLAVGDFWVFRPNMGFDSTYLYSLIQSPLFQTVSNISTGTKMPRADWGLVSNTEFMTPPSKREQSKIGQFFLDLDTLFTLTQRKLDKLRDLKTAMLGKMFPQEGRDVPEIRFAGFSEPWERRRFWELGSVAMNKRIFKNQTSESGEVPFFKIGTFGGTPDAYITRELFEEYRARYPYPKKGDILISASGSIGRIVEYGGEDAYFQDSNIVWLEHDETIINPFLKHLYGVISWAGIEGSTIKRLYNENILKTEIMLPRVEEQKAIASFLDKADVIIFLCQRKLDKLRDLKTAMLGKMFV